MHEPSRIDKVIWICWLQGLASAPPIVRACVDRWVQLNPSWDVRILGMSDVERYTDVLDRFDLSSKAITPAAFSDILRTSLLKRHGGVWADATTYCNRPLDDWLWDLTDTGFFAFKAPAPNRPLSSWFLASTRDNKIITELHERVQRYWDARDGADHYFWFHFLFRNVLKREPEIACLWDKIPHMSATDAQKFQKIMNLPARRMRGPVDTSPPMFKLTHKVPDMRPDALVRKFLSLERWENQETSAESDKHPALSLLAHPSVLPYK